MADYGGQVTVGTTGYNFCWFYPRRTAEHCYVMLRVPTDQRDTVVEQLTKAGITASPNRRHEIKMRITSPAEVEAHAELLQRVLADSEASSRDPV